MLSSFNETFFFQFVRSFIFASSAPFYTLSEELWKELRQRLVPLLLFVPRPMSALEA